MNRSLSPPLICFILALGRIGSAGAAPPAPRNTPEPAVDATIQEIQQYAPGITEGTRVHTKGICSVATGSFGFAITVLADSSSGPTWSGIHVHVPD